MNKKDIVLKKEVGKSVLQFGIAVSTEEQDILFSKLGYRLVRGESRTVKFIFGNKSFDVTFSNENVKKPEEQHIERVRFLYRQNGIKELLKTIFCDTYNKLGLNFERQDNSSYKQNLLEYIILYKSPRKDVFFIQCLVNTPYIDWSNNDIKEAFPIQQNLNFTENDDDIDYESIMKDLII